MTINYKEKNVTGVEWQRCSAVVIHNDLTSTPNVVFQEEGVIDIGGSYIKKAIVDPLIIAYTPTKTFQVLNPNDNTPTGTTMTHQDVYNILYSLYMQAALERDNPTPP